MPLALKVALAIAHFSVYLVVALSIWIFSRRHDFYTHVVKLRSLPAIYWGYACFAVATSYEVAEHMADDWFYVSQISGLNNLFYSFIVFGLVLISLGLKKNRILDVVLIACAVATPILYGYNDSKVAIQIPQLITGLIFVYKWHAIMKDWRVFLYFLFSNILAVGFGIALIATNNQLLHLFVGPLNASGLIVLGYLAWIYPQRHLADGSGHE